MKNISLILNGILLLAVAHLYYLNFKKPAPAQVIMPAATQSGGVKIAHVNADTLDAKYEWLKQQKTAIQDRLTNAENRMTAKQSALEKDFMALQEKYQTGTVPRADIEKEAQGLEQRRTKLQEEAAGLERQLGEEQRKAMNDLMANVENKLKELQSQIGFDYILSYSRGGQILLANDSLDITKQVLELLNAKEEKK